MTSPDEALSLGGQQGSEERGKKGRREGGMEGRRGEGEKKRRREGEKREGGKKGGRELGTRPRANRHHRTPKPRTQKGKQTNMFAKTSKSTDKSTNTRSIEAHTCVQAHNQNASKQQ